jgi:hypothetical protein
MKERSCIKIVKLLISRIISWNKNGSSDYRAMSFYSFTRCVKLIST